MSLEFSESGNDSIELYDQSNVYIDFYEKISKKKKKIGGVEISIGYVETAIQDEF